MGWMLPAGSIADASAVTASQSVEKESSHFMSVVVRRLLLLRNSTVPY